MNQIKAFSGMLPEMDRWMVEQLIAKRPHKEIVDEVFERYPGFGRNNGRALSYAEMDKRIRDLIKAVMRSKFGDDIRSQRRHREQVAQMTLADKEYRDAKREEIWDAMLVINKKFDNENLSREEQIRLKGKLSILKSMRQELDAYERSEARNNASNDVWVTDFLDVQLHEVEEEDDDQPQLPPPSAAQVEPEVEPEPTEPPWWEIDDSEHLTI